MGAPGTKNGNAKLTPELVREVRRQYWWELVTQRDIAVAMGLSQSVVCKIVNGKLWPTAPQ